MSIKIRGGFIELTEIRPINISVGDETKEVAVCLQISMIWDLFGCQYTESYDDILNALEEYKNKHDNTFDVFG